MPLVIPAGQSARVDVVLSVVGDGEQEFGFDLYVDSKDTLFIEAIGEKVTVVKPADDDSVK